MAKVTLLLTAREVSVRWVLDRVFLTVPSVSCVGAFAGEDTLESSFLLGWVLRERVSVGAVM